MRSRVRPWRPLALRISWISAVMVVFAGCSSVASHRETLEPLIAVGDWEEIRARVELLRQEGEAGSWIDLAEGIALLHQNADKAAEPLFESAVAADSSLALLVAEHLATLSRQDHEQGWEERARRRMADALRLDPSIDPGDQISFVADYFFRFSRDFERAYPLYRRLYRERPEPTSRHREWVYRYGHCLESLGFEDTAMAVYEEYISTWPDDLSIMRYVQWRRMNLLIEQAEELRGAAQPARALELLTQCIDNGWHVDLQQRARYLAGEIEEDRNDLHAARAWYEQVVDAGGSAGSQLVVSARARLDALGALGVH